jgi:release factor glutamine methyltransferase
LLSPSACSPSGSLVFLLFARAAIIHDFENHICRPDLVHDGRSRTTEARVSAPVTTSTWVAPARTKEWMRRGIHFILYHLLLKRTARRRTKVVRAAGFRLVVRPSVFHPRFFLSSEIFAGFVAQLDLAGKSVADVGTGSGIIALAAARAGAARVVAVDINPDAARSAGENTRLNGLSDRCHALCSNLLSAVAPQPLFDVILSNPPYFAGEPLDLADRAWHAGPGYRDIAPMFEQCRERLKPGGRIYLLVSSDSDLDALAAMYGAAGLQARLVHRRGVFFEALLIFELHAD